MLCTPIKLSNRSSHPGEKDTNKYRSTLLDEKLYMKSDYYHSYTFRWDRSKKIIRTQNTNNSLVVNNILPPENISSFNTGSSMQRWSNKRPRLKSNPHQKREPSPRITESEDSFNITTLVNKFSAEVEMERQRESQELEDTEEIDPDIQRLISISQGSSTDQDQEDDQKRKRRHKRKDKKESGKAKRKLKTIRFALSKPPSPQTIQVIRVDVTSNYSLEEESYSELNKIQTNKIEMNNVDCSLLVDCSKGCGKKIRSGLESKKPTFKKQFSLQCEDDEVDLLCRKLMLMERNEENEAF